MHHRAKCYQNQLNCSDCTDGHHFDNRISYDCTRYGYQSGGRPPSWIYWARIRASHDDYLVVFIAMQNLVGISAVVSITVQLDATVFFSYPFN